jgi:hypothetical protein
MTFDFPWPGGMRRQSALVDASCGEIVAKQKGRRSGL